MGRRTIAKIAEDDARDAAELADLLAEIDRLEKLRPTS